MVLYGFLGFRWNGLEVSLFLRFGVEVQHRAEDLLEVLACHLRNVGVEKNVNERSAGVVLWIGGSDGGFSAGATDADALIPLLLLDGTAVNLDVNVVIFEYHVGDANRVSVFGRRSPHGNLLLQFSAAGSDHSVIEF